MPRGHAIGALPATSTLNTPNELLPHAPDSIEGSLQPRESVEHRITDAPYQSTAQLTRFAQESLSRLSVQVKKRPRCTQCLTKYLPEAPQGIAKSF